MAWRIVKRISVASNDPLITINRQRFSYNMPFVRLAELGKNPYVIYSVDEENHKVGFDFGDKETENSSKVIGNNKQGYISQSTELFRLGWIKKAGSVKNQNKYRPIRDGKKWVITLRPAFENSIKREDIGTINSELKGIYRYLDNGKIVYIGKGNIRKRYNDEQRKEWKFDTVEYSIINSSDEQFEWEAFWIDEFKKENGDFLPPYNLVSGHSNNGD